MSQHIFDEVTKLCPQLLTEFGFQVVEVSRASELANGASFARFKNDPIIVTFSRDRGSIESDVGSDLEPKESYPFFQIAELLGKTYAQDRIRVLENFKPFEEQGSEVLDFEVNFLLSNLKEISDLFRPENYKSTKKLLAEVAKRLWEKRYREMRQAYLRQN